MASPWVAMVELVARHLDSLVETNMVELVSLLFVDLVNYHNELAVAAPLAVLLALCSSVAVLGFVHGFSLSLTLVLPEYCAHGLLAGGVACCEVEQLPRSSRFATSELVDECLIGCVRDERSDHVHVHDIRELIALLGEAVDVLM